MPEMCGYVEKCDDLGYENLQHQNTPHGNKGSILTNCNIESSSMIPFSSISTLLMEFDERMFSNSNHACLATSRVIVFGGRLGGDV